MVPGRLAPAWGRRRQRRFNASLAEGRSERGIGRDRKGCKRQINRGTKERIRERKGKRRNI